MFRANQRREAITYYIFSMWRNWSVSMGMACAVIVLSPFVSKSLLPLVALLLVAVLMILMRRNRNAGRPTCFRVPYIVTCTLFITAALMVLLNLTYNHMEIEWSGQPLNPDQPFISNLIMAPVFVIVSAVYLAGGMNSRFCRECSAHIGSAADRGFMGRILAKEATMQTRFLFVMSLLIAAVEWGYYFIYFVTVNLNRPDMFFFFWLPVIVYLLSLVYFGFRYYSMWVYYCHNDELSIIERNSSSSLRYLIISGDLLYLKKSDRIGDKDYGEYDTPARIQLPFRSRITEYDAKTDFKMLSGVSDCFMRFLYESSNLCTLNNAFHYLCYLDDKSMIEGSRISGGEWLSLSAVDRLMRDRSLSYDLSAEIMRIYKVAMAWKTYDRQGRRLYKIKNYNPTFRFCDIKDWDVDFNDRNWLLVSANNEDRPFFRLRRLWQKYVTGKK